MCTHTHREINRAFWNARFNSTQQWSAAIYQVSTTQLKLCVERSGFQLNVKVRIKFIIQPNPEKDLKSPVWSFSDFRRYFSFNARKGKNSQPELRGCQPSASYLCEQAEALIGLEFVASSLASYWSHSNTARAAPPKATARKTNRQKERMKHESCSRRHFPWSASSQICKHEMHRVPPLKTQLLIYTRATAKCNESTSTSGTCGVTHWMTCAAHIKHTNVRLWTSAECKTSQAVDNTLITSILDHGGS